MNVRMPAAATIALVIAACASGAVHTTSSLPTQPPASASQPAIATAAPTASATPTPEASALLETSPSPHASPTPYVMPVADGEQWITYEWYAGHDYKSVLLVRPSGANPHVIAADLPGEHRGPAWSPDGSRIAFINIDTDAPDGTLWLMDADGSNAERLVDPKGDCVASYWPAWSPDGTQIAFVCYGSEDESFATIDLATGTINPLTTFKWPDHLDNPPTWSPDGTTIAFDLQHWDPSDQFLDGSRIGTVPSNGGSVTWLTEFDSFAAWPDWHPTQDLIVYNTYDLGNMHLVDHPSNIWTMRSDGSDGQQITNATDPAKLRPAQPRWLPDGSGLILSCASGNPVEDVVVCMADQSTGLLPLFGLPHGARPDMRPTPEQIGGGPLAVD